MSTDPLATVVSGTTTAATQVSPPTASEPTAPLIPKVEIQGLLGRGGMGAVWRGRHTFLDRMVAVKTLLVPSGDAGRDFVRRFEREARILASLSHPHIVACHDAGVLADGAPYLVMEFIAGGSLKQHVEAHGPLSEADALRLTAEMADGLAHAHAIGVIHRDVKPENVLLATTADGGWTAKLVDLGLARPQHAGDSSLTLVGAVVGTPATMAPEQFETPESVDARADMYGLGCTLFTALSGSPAFSGGTIASIVAAKVGGQIPDITAQRSDVSAQTCALLRSLLARRVADRPATWEACRAAIAAARSRQIPAHGATRPWFGIAATVVVLAVIVVAIAAVRLWSGTPAVSRPAVPSATASVSLVPATAATQKHSGIPETKHATLRPRATRPAFAGERDLFAAAVEQRLVGWTTTSAWAHNEIGEGVVGVAGSVSHALPDRPWRVHTRLEPSFRRGALTEHCGVAFELEDGVLLSVVVGQLSELTVSLAVIPRFGELPSNVLSATSAPLAPLRIGAECWNGNLMVTVNDRALPAAALSKPITRVHLWVKNGPGMRSRGPLTVPFVRLSVADEP